MTTNMPTTKDSFDVRCDVSYKIYSQFASEKLNGKAVDCLARSVADAREAAMKAINELTNLINALDDEDASKTLFALQSAARHAGYSNSATTYVNEVTAACGEAAGMVEVMF